MKKYLENTYYVDYSTPSVRDLVKKLKLQSSDDVSLIQLTYEYVRDKIHHSWEIEAVVLMSKAEKREIINNRRICILDPILDIWPVRAERIVMLLLSARMRVRYGL